MLKTRKPHWLKVKIPSSENYSNINKLIKSTSLATVCQEARCPNIHECWESGTATFMLMGDTCTRACKFCAVKTGNPQGILNTNEAFEVSTSIKAMNLKYVVLTSVDRDDLIDLGSSHFAEVIKTIACEIPEIKIECLTPDFNANKEFIKKVLMSKPHVFAHNIETIRRLTPTVRDRRANYDQSIETLRFAKECSIKNSLNIYTKTSIMLGLGETFEEVIETMKDLKEIDVDVITFGQYLSPTSFHKKYLPVVEYIHPNVFDKLKQIALDMNFLFCASGPLVRSSYKASEQFLYNKLQ